MAGRSAAARLLELHVRIPPGAWMFVCCECCVLSGRGLCDGLITRPEESYRMWGVVVCDQETSKTRRLKPATGLWKYVLNYEVVPTFLDNLCTWGLNNSKELLSNFWNTALWIVNCDSRTVYNLILISTVHSLTTLGILQPHLISTTKLDVPCTIPILWEISAMANENQRISSDGVRYFW